MKTPFRYSIVAIATVWLALSYNCVVLGERSSFVFEEPDANGFYHHQEMVAGVFNLTYTGRPSKDLVRLPAGCILSCGPSAAVIDNSCISQLEINSLITTEEPFVCTDELQLMHRVVQIISKEPTSTLILERVTLQTAIPDLELSFSAPDLGRYMGYIQKRGLFSGRFNPFPSAVTAVVNRAKTKLSQTREKAISTVKAAIPTIRKEAGAAAVAFLKPAGVVVNQIQQGVRQVEQILTKINEGSARLPPFERQLLNWNYATHTKRAMKSRMPLQSGSGYDLFCQECFAYADIGLSASAEWKLITQSVKTRITGSLDSQLNGDLVLVVTKGVDKTWNKQIFTGTNGPYVVFSVMGVPIMLTITTSLNLAASIGVSGRGSMRTGFDASLNLQRGMEFRYPAFFSQTTPVTNVAKQFHPFTRSASVSGFAELSMEVGVTFSLQYFAHLEIKAIPYIRGTTSSGTTKCALEYSYDLGIRNSLAFYVAMKFPPLFSYSTKRQTYSLPSFGPYRNSGCVKSSAVSLGTPDFATLSASEQDALTMLHQLLTEAATYTTPDYDGLSGAGTYSFTPEGAFLYDPKAVERTGSAQTTNAGILIPTISQSANSFKIISPRGITLAEAGDDECDQNHSVLSVDTAKRVVIDTCDGDSGANTCSASAEDTRSKVYNLRVRFTLTGKWEIGVSNTSFVVTVRRDSICGHHVDCLFGNLTLTVSNTSEWYSLSVGSDKPTCGSVTLSFSSPRVLELYVDTNPAYGKNLASQPGTYRESFATIDYALQRASFMYQAAQHDAVVIFLWPNYGPIIYPAYSVELATGLIIPTNLKGVVLKISSLNEGLTARAMMELYERYECFNIPLDLCLSRDEFITATYGTCFDTEIKVRGNVLLSSDTTSLELHGLWLESLLSKDQGVSSVVVQSGNVTLRNSLLYYNYDSIAGADVKVVGNGFLDMDGCVSLNARSGQFGGSVAISSDGTARINDCLFSGSSTVNRTAGAGGAIAVSDRGALTLTQSEIRGASSRYGGGLALLSNDCQVDLDTVKFRDCKAAEAGGAVSVEGGFLVMDTCSVTSCHSWGRGSALAMTGSGSFVQLINTTVAQNSASQISVNNSASLSLTGSWIEDGGSYQPTTLIGTNQASVSGSASAPAANIACANGWMNLEDNRLTDMTTGEKLSSVECNSCTGCASCDNCGPCEICTATGCDASKKLEKCRDLYGVLASCNAQSGQCESPEMALTNTMFGTPVPTYGFFALCFSLGVVIAAIVSCSVLVCCCFRKSTK